MVAPGGAVLQIAGDDQDQLWLASPAGLFHFDGQDWQNIRRGIPFWRLNTILAVGRNLWASGMPGGILRSANRGKSWHRAWIEQTEAPIITLAASPNYARDRVLLAGTDGDGILRSTDGGRHWELANFGLREFMVLDLATAPVWDRYEYAFAITERGVYQSPNGGRAWRRVNLGQDILPTAVVISPEFATDQTVFVGGQDGELFVSTDAGQAWQLAAEGLGMINALAFSPLSSLLIGTANIIYRLPAGKTAVYPFDLDECDSFDLPTAVLTLNDVADTLYAGLVDGLYQSQDDGRSWQPDPGLSARHFIWYLTPLPDHWLAAGPEEAVWLSQNGGQSWQAIWDSEAVLAIAAVKGQIWVSTPDGVISSTDNGASWQVAFAPGAPITAMTYGQVLWAGSPSGEVWRVIDDELQTTVVPYSNAQLLGLYAQGSVVITAVWSTETGMIQLWRTEDGGDQWQLWFSHSSHPMIPQVAFQDETGDTAVVGLGTNVFLQTATSWQRQNVTGKDAPITALLSNQGNLLASFTDRLVSAESIDDWQSFTNMVGYPIVALKNIPAEAGSGQVFVGTADGRIFLTQEE